MSENEPQGGCSQCGTPAHIGCECAKTKQEAPAENESPNEKERRTSALLELAGVSNLVEAQELIKKYSREDIPRENGKLRIIENWEGKVQFAKAAVAENEGKSAKPFASEGVRLTAIGLQKEVSDAVNGIYTSD